MKKAKLKRFWNNTKLRFALFRVWFMKNIKLFIQMFCMACLVCIFTGVIDSETPILGNTIYLLFEPLVREINNTIRDREIENLMNVFSIIISVLMSITMFTVKVKKIAVTDIKSDKLKYALIQANLYFNQDGVLVKKIEKATGSDIDGDGKIDDETIENSTRKKGFIRNVVDAVKEFGVIMSADLNDDTKSTRETVDEVIENANLEDAVDATTEIDKIIEVGVNNIACDAGEKLIYNEISNLVENSELDNMEKIEKVSILERIKNFFRRKRKNIDEELENIDTDVITNNIESDSTLDDEKEETVEENTSNVIEVSANSEVQQRKLSKQEEFIEKLKNRNK